MLFCCSLDTGDGETEVPYGINSRGIAAAQEPSACDTLPLISASLFPTVAHRAL
uniref:Uncharacterized protein n=1 Tax=Anguilla anguilla TaxID=7936 RepID=A0A0E9PR80_ANGAN